MPLDSAEIARFRELLEAAPVAMVMVDGAGRIVLANWHAEKIFGFARHELLGRPVEMLVPERFRAGHPAYRAGFFADLSVRPMGAGRDLYGLHRNGSEVPIEIGLNPLFTAEGTFVLSSIVDITERRRAVEQFRLAIEASPTGMLMVDRDGHIVLVNAQVEKLFGYEREELIGQPLEMLVPERFRAGHPAYRAGFFAELSARSMGAGRDLYGLHRDGSEVPVEIGLNPLATPEGVFVLSSIVDITERKRASEQLQASLREKETLLKEVHHRVKNNLQIVSSLLSLQAHHAPAVAHTLGEMQNRVRSIALFHEKVYQSHDLAGVEVAGYLRDLATTLLYHYDVAPERVGLAVESEGISLAVDRAIPCGLIANELISNALKHAFPNNRSGRVEVRVEREGELGLVLAVGDDGIGLPESCDPSNSTTLGLRLVATLARQLDGTMEVMRAGGTRFVVRFPETSA